MLPLSPQGSVNMSNTFNLVSIGNHRTTFALTRYSARRLLSRSGHAPVTRHMAQAFKSAWRHARCGPPVALRLLLSDRGKKTTSRGAADLHFAFLHPNRLKRTAFLPVFETRSSAAIVYSRSLLYPNFTTHIRLVQNGRNPSSKGGMVRQAQ